MVVGPIFTAMGNPISCHWVRLMSGKHIDWLHNERVPQGSVVQPTQSYTVKLEDESCAPAITL